MVRMRTMKLTEMRMAIVEAGRDGMALEPEDPAGQEHEIGRVARRPGGLSLRDPVVGVGGMVVGKGRPGGDQDDHNEQGERALERGEHGWDPP